MAIRMRYLLFVRLCMASGLMAFALYCPGVIAFADGSGSDFTEEHNVQLKRDGEGHVTDVRFIEQPPTNEMLGMLQSLPRLRSLVLAGTATQDDALRQIAELSGLRNLDLRNCPVSNAGLAHLIGMKSLAALRLSGATGETTVDDKGMASLAKIKTLETVMLDGLWISEEGLKPLVAIEGLVELTLAQSLAGDEALSVIAQMKNLCRLRLAKTAITSHGLRAISVLSKLRDLDLSECASLDNESLETVGTLVQLERLNLWRVPVGDAGIRHLAALRKIRWLNLDNTMLTDEGMGTLAGMPGLSTLHIGSTAVSNTGIQHLAEARSLREVFLARTAVDATGVATLRKKLPKATIVDITAD